MANFVGLLVGVIAALWLGGLARLAIARLLRMRVSRVSLGLGPRVLSAGAVEVCAFPLAIRVAVDGEDATARGPGEAAAEAWWQRPAWQRLLLIVAAPVAAWVTAVLIATGMALAWGTPTYAAGADVTSVRDGSPAAVAGITRGDRVLTVDGRAIVDTPDVVAAVEDAAGRPVDLRLARDGAERTVTVAPRLDGPHWRIGVALEPAMTWRRPSLTHALAVGVAYVDGYFASLASSLARAMAGSEKVSFAGPVGLVKYQTRAVAGPPAGAYLAVALACWVAIFHLLPIPPLAGCSLILFVAALLTRRRPSRRLATGITVAGGIVCGVIGLLVTAVAVRAVLYRSLL